MDFLLLSERKVAELTGKAMVGALTQPEMMALCNHITALETYLDEADNNDTFGTQGWRYFFGVPDAD